MFLRALFFILLSTTTLAVLKLEAQYVGSLSGGGFSGFDSDHPYNFDVRALVIPSPDSMIELLEQVRNKSVADAITIDTEQQQVILKELKAVNSVQASGNPNRLTKTELLAERKSKLVPIVQRMDEIVTPEKLQRLREVVYQIEVYYLGFAKALKNGRLGQKVSVHENQFTALEEKSAKIQKEMEQEIAQVMEKYQDKFLAELSTEQREVAKSLLGKPFVYKLPVTKTFSKSPSPWLIP